MAFFPGHLKELFGSFSETRGEFTIQLPVEWFVVQVGTLENPVIEVRTDIGPGSRNLHRKKLGYREEPIKHSRTEIANSR